MKIGQKIWICHDEKWSRKKEGIVVGTKNGYRIKVKFLEGDDKDIEFWARKHQAIRYDMKDIMENILVLIIMKKDT